MLSTALQSKGFSATDALRHAVLALQQAHIETASLDARILLQYILGISREQLLSDYGLILSPRQYSAYFALIEKRAGRQPVAQLTGRREFWDLAFKVTHHTLDPRPDSEALIEAVLARFRDRGQKLRVLDLGTGTGCLLLTLLKEYPEASGVGVDICEEALSVAQENALNLGLPPRAGFVQSCWGEQVKEMFDIVISNPPYIPTEAIGRLAPEVAKYEPKLALDGGEDGLRCYREIVSQLPRLLSPQGLAVFEIGFGQARELQSIVESHGLQVVGIKEDLAHIPRCVLVSHCNNN